MFTRNASRHDTVVSAPVAALRAGPLGKVVATRARPVGLAMAAPTPCNNRAMTRVVSSQATPHSTEAMVNSATPAMKVRLRPMVSPSRPPSSIRPPKVRT